MIWNLLVLFIGISGILAIGTNFLLEVTNKIEKNHHIFTLINLYGSVALCVYSFYNKVWLFVILNGFLILISVYGIYLAFKK